MELRLKERKLPIYFWGELRKKLYKLRIVKKKETKTTH